MKKTFSLLLMLFVFNLNAQLWFDFGLNGALGSGFYMGNSFFSDSRFNVAPKLNHSFTLKIGINPSNQHAAVVELGYGNRAYAMDQAFVPGQNDNSVFTQQINFSGFQGALLYRNTNEGTFIELGPMFNLIQNQTYSDQVSNFYNNQTFLTSKVVRGVFGLGGYILGNERVTLVAGFRLLYDFSDLRAKDNIGEMFPFQNYNESALYKPLHALDFQLNLELNVSLGFLARASCGKRSVVFKW